MCTPSLTCYHHHIHSYIVIREITLLQSCLYYCGHWFQFFLPFTFWTVRLRWRSRIRTHRQLLPQIRFWKSFLDTIYSFRVLALRPSFTEPILRQESPGACKSTVFYRTPAPIIVYYFPYITCLLYLLFLIKHVRTSG